jgi:small subunit ribosomal protein S20
MPMLKNAKKALRVSQKKTVYNGQIKSKLKTALDEVKKSPAAASLSNAFSKIDRAVKKQVIHKNKAAHLKSSLSKLLKK